MISVSNEDLFDRPAFSPYFSVVFLGRGYFVKISYQKLCKTTSAFENTAQEVWEEKDKAEKHCVIYLQQRNLSTSELIF